MVAVSKISTLCFIAPVALMALFQAPVTAIKLRGDSAAQGETMVMNPPTSPPVVEDDKALVSFLETPKIPKKAKTVVQRIGKSLGFTSEKACESKKAKGETPELRSYGAKITAGYPSYDERTRKTVVESRIPLNMVNGYRQPIKVGAEDYVVQGNAAQISEFFSCFSEYEVQASTLTESGHWTSDPQECGPLFMQIESVSPFQGSASQIMFRYSIERVLEEIAPNDVILDMLSQISAAIPKMTAVLEASKRGYGIFKDIPGKIALLKEYLNLDAKEIQAAWSKMKLIKDTTSRVGILASVLAKRNRRTIKGKWSELGNFDPTGKMTVTLTSYPKPSHGIRATYAFSTCKVSIEDIQQAFDGAVANTKVAEYMMKASELAAKL